MTQPLQRERVSESVPLSGVPQDHEASVARDSVVRDIDELLSGGTIEDATDRRLLNEAALFLRAPHGDALTLIGQQENVAAVIAGYEMTGADVSPQIMAIYERLMDFSFQTQELEVKETPLTTAEILQQLRDLPRLTGGANADPTNELRLQHIALTERLCRAQFKDVEVALAVGMPDIPQCKKLMQIAFGTAKQLLDGFAQKGDMMLELSAWQAEMKGNYDQSVGALVASYDSQIELELQKTKPDPIELKRWMTLAAGFAPDRADVLRAKYQEGIRIYCGTFLADIDAELLKEAPDRGAIGRWMTLLDLHAKALDAGTDIPERIEALRQRIDAPKV